AVRKSLADDGPFFEGDGKFGGQHRYLPIGTGYFVICHWSLVTRRNRWAVIRSQSRAPTGLSAPGAGQVTNDKGQALGRHSSGLGFSFCQIASSSGSTPCLLTPEMGKISLPLSFARRASMASLS